jgi:hypothetical protein
MAIDIKEITYGKHISDKLSHDSLIIIPNNLSNKNKKFVYSNTTTSVFKELKANDINVTLFDIDPEQIYLEEKRSIDWIVPTFFVSTSLLSQQPLLISLAINVISNYIYDTLKGEKAKINTKMSIVIKDEEKGLLKKVDYDGPVEGLPELAAIIKELYDK